MDIFLAYKNHDKCHFKTESYRNMSYNDDELWFIKKIQIKRNIRVWYTKGLKMGKKYDSTSNIGRWYLPHHQKQEEKICGNVKFAQQ